MGHFAFINENNEVLGVITGRNEDEIVDGISNWEEYYSARRGGVKTLRVSYNTHGGVHYNPETGEPSEDQSKALRYNYPGPGFVYDEQKDGFIPPKPFQSWVLNEQTLLWEPPIPAPGLDGEHQWNEDTVSWEPVSEV